MNFRVRRVEDPEINLVSLIDVVLMTEELKCSTYA